MFMIGKYSPAVATAMRITALVAVMQMQIIPSAASTGSEENSGCLRRFKERFRKGLEYLGLGAKTPKRRQKRKQQVRAIIVSVVKKIIILQCLIKGVTAQTPWNADVATNARIMELSRQAVAIEFSETETRAGRIQLTQRLLRDGRDNEDFRVIVGQVAMDNGLDITESGWDEIITEAPTPRPTAIRLSEAEIERLEEEAARQAEEALAAETRAKAGKCNKAQEVLDGKSQLWLVTEWTTKNPQNQHWAIRRVMKCIRDRVKGWVGAAADVVESVVEEVKEFTEAELRAIANSSLTQAFREVLNDLRKRNCTCAP